MRSRSNSAIAPEDVHLQLAGGCGGVDPFGQADACDAEGPQVVEQGDQMLQVPTEPIETPADQDIEPASLGIGEQLIESGTSILRPAHPAINVLDARPSPRLDLPAGVPAVGSVVGRATR